MQLFSQVEAVDGRSKPPLQSRVASHAAWVVGWRLTTRILGFTSTFILARLLAPTDFGLIALAITLTDAVDALSAVGIQDAIVREQAPDRTLYDTAFSMNAVRCLITSFFVGAAAWPAAEFFAEPNLSRVLLALAAVTAAGAGENIRVVDFRRDMAFHKEFKLFLLPRLASITASIAGAAIWHSYWALIAGLVTNRLLQLVLGYVLRPYRPRLCFRDWRKIVGFSVWTWLSSLVATVRDRSANIVVGRVLGAAQVGLFSVGAELASLPTTELVTPLCRVLFPRFAAMRAVGGDLAETYFQVIAVTLLVTAPAGVGISMVAGPIVTLMFGARWSAAAPVVAVVAIAGTMKVVSLISGTLFAATGLLHANFHIIVVTALLRIACLTLLVEDLGMLGGAVAILVSVIIEEAMFLVAATRRLGFPIWELPRRTWRSVVASVVMAAALSLTGFGWPVAAGGPVAHLLAAVPLGVAAYLLALAAAWFLAGRPDGAELEVARATAHLGLRLLGALQRPSRNNG